MEFKKKKLPIYKLKVNSANTGVEYVALVDQPAIDRAFQAFNENKKFDFKANEEKRMVSGYLMLADTPIYRRDDNMGEYYVVFDKPTIEQIMVKFAKNNYQNNVNKMHQKEQKVNGMYMIEMFMVDSERGLKQPKGHDEAPDGSWFATYKVEDDKLWNEIKSGNFYMGFSVEGEFEYDLDEAFTAQVKEVLRAIEQITR